MFVRLYLIAFALFSSFLSTSPHCAQAANGKTSTELSLEQKVQQLTALLEQNQYKQPLLALDYALELKPLLQTTPEDPRYLELLLTLIRLNINHSHIQDAESNLFEIQNLNQQAIPPSLKVRTLIARALLLREKAQLQAALVLLSRAYEKAHAMQDAMLLAITEYEQGVAHFFLGHIDDAIDKVSSAHYTFSAAADLRWQSKSLNILGILYGSQGRYDESLQAMMDALDIAQQLEDVITEMALYNNIALTFNGLEKYQQALDTYQKTLRLAQRHQEKSSEALAWINLGFVYKDLEQLEQAKKHFKKGLTQAFTLDNKPLSVRALSGLSNLARLENNPPLTIEYANRALSISSQLGDMTVAPGPKANLAWAHLQQGELDKALTLAEENLNAAREKGEKAQLLKILALLSDIHDARQEPEQALSYLRQHLEVKDLMFNDRSDKNIARLRAQFELEQKDLKIEKLASEKRLKEVELEVQKALQQNLIEKKQLQRNIIIVGLISLFAIVFFAYTRRTQRQQNIALTHKVQQRTEELKRKHEELQKAYQQMENQSLSDELTGLQNRRFVLQHLPEDIQRLHSQSQEQEANQHLIFFLIDIDRFKNVNDEHGHAAGDRILCDMGQLLKQVFRQTDYQVRWGGEEFLVIMRFVDRTQAGQYAERLRLAVEQKQFEVNADTHLQCSCSIGFACYPFFANSPDAVSWNQVPYGGRSQPVCRKKIQPQRLGRTGFLSSPSLPFSFQ